MAELIDKNDTIKMLRKNSAVVFLTNAEGKNVLDIVADMPTTTESEIRAKAIDDVFEFLKSKRGKRYMNVNLDDLEIRKYKEQLKGSEE